MKKSIIGWKGMLAFLFLSTSSTSFGQYQNLAVQPRFDTVYTKLYGPIYNIGTTSNNINDQGQLTWVKSELYHQVFPGMYTQLSLNSQNALGSTRSGSLEALLRMYEATCEMK